MTFESMSIEDMAEISGSQKLCEMLTKEHLGFKFTAKQLRRIAQVAGHDLTEGVVSGFITRAQNKGMIDIVGRVPVIKGKSPQIYKLVSKEAWKFHSPGIGSIAGRVIRSSKQGELPLVEPEEGNKVGAAFTVHYQNNDLEQAYVDDHLNIMRAVSGKDDPYSPVDGETSDGFKLHYEPGSITDRLVQIAIEVNELENRPTKSLKDFSTEEIIDELKCRLK